MFFAASTTSVRRVRFVRLAIAQTGNLRGELMSAVRTHDGSSVRQRRDTSEARDIRDSEEPACWQPVGDDLISLPMFPAFSEFNVNAGGAVSH